MLSPFHSNVVSTIQEDHLLPSVRHWKILGGLATVAGIAVALGLATVVKYKVTVKAEAELRPLGELRIVQAATEGTVVDILTQEHQSVRQGDVIAILDDSRLQTQKYQLQNRIQQAQNQLLSINAQITALDRQSTAERNRIQRAIAGADAELSQRYRDHQEKQVVTVADVEEAEANLKAAAASLTAARSKQSRYRVGVEAGAISQDQFEEVQLAVRQQEQSFEAAKARKQRVEAALNPSTAEVAVIREQIAQEKATSQANLATLDKERQTLIQQRIETTKQLEDERRELQQVTLELKRTTITATADGMLTQLNLRNSGQTVRAGEAIAQIVPHNVPLVIKAAVSPEHRNKVELGQTTQMRVSACPYPDYGTLRGTVTQISEDTLKPDVRQAPTATIANQAGRPGAVYEVTIQPETLLLNRDQNQCAVEPGMHGTVDIISREENVLQFFLRKARLSANL